MSTLNNYVTNFTGPIVIRSHDYTFNSKNKSVELVQEKYFNTFIDNRLCKKIDYVDIISATFTYGNGVFMTVTCKIVADMADYNVGSILCDFKKYNIVLPETKICSFIHQTDKEISLNLSKLSLWGVEEHLRDESNIIPWKRIIQKMNDLGEENLFGVVKKVQETERNNLTILVTPLNFMPVLVKTSMPEILDQKEFMFKIFKHELVEMKNKEIIEHKSMVIMKSMIADEFHRKRKMYGGETVIKSRVVADMYYWIDVTGIYPYDKSSAITKHISPIEINKEDIMKLSIRLHNMINSLVLKLFRQSPDNCVNILAAYIENATKEGQ